MGSGQLQWDAVDVVGAARLNGKTVFVGTGAQISGRTDALQPGEVAYCTSTGSGFTADHYYIRNAANTIWFDFTTIAGSFVYVLDQTIGDYTTPTSATANSVDFATPTTIGATTSQGTIFGSVVVSKITGLIAGSKITSVGVNFQASSGNFRVKVYQDDGTGGAPSTLLGESNSTATALGWVDASLISAALVPASGNVWIGCETDNSTADPYFATTGTRYFVTHTYGTGPNPFGTGTTDNTQILNTRINQGVTVHGASNAVDNNTATEWISGNTVNPNIFVDMGAAGNLVEMAIYPDSTTTTATQIEIDTSPDSTTWTQIRLLNMTELTNATWNFIRWNPANTAQPRYVRVRATDAGSVVLAIWEIKVLNPAQWLMSVEHGHKNIPVNTAGLGAGV